MLRTVVLALITLSIAIGGGTASVWYVLQRADDFGAVQLGEWTTHPAVGTPQADPYAKARFARDGRLAIGAAEGVIFTAARDATGRPLVAACDYLVAGSIPPSRFWTIHAVARPALPYNADHALHSLALLRREGGGVDISISRHAMAGNWLPLDFDGRFELVLSLYDTPSVGSAQVTDVPLPRISRERCDG